MYNFYLSVIPQESWGKNNEQNGEKRSNVDSTGTDLGTGLMETDARGERPGLIAWHGQQVALKEPERERRKAAARIRVRNLDSVQM